MNKKINIAIDGPAGSGKGTTAKLLANELNYKFLDTGAMYRAITYYFDKNSIKKEDIKEESFKNINIDFDLEQNVLLNGENIEKYIRNSKIAELTSSYSTKKEIRDFLSKLQKKIVLEKGYIAEGRDIGSIIMPEAELKIYLTANIDIRARRRLEDFKKQGILMEIDDIKQQIIERDHQDSTRDIAPLVKVKDAIEIDTSYINIPTQIEIIKKLALKHINYKKEKN